MSNFYEIDTYKGFLLYSYDHQIILRQKFGHAFNRPQVLCQDYLANLSSSIYQGNLYYAYQNTQQHLVIDSTLGQSFPFQLNPNEFTKYMDPCLFTLGHKLLLLFLEYDTKNQYYSIRCVTPYEDDAPLTITDKTWALKPTILYHSSKNGIFITIHVQAETQFLWLTSAYNCINLTSYEELNAVYEDKYQQLNRSYNKKYQELSDTNQIHLEQMEQELKQSDNQLKLQAAELSNLNHKLTSAVEQYHDLMLVATQYKDDAKKWHDLYLNR